MTLYSGAVVVLYFSCLVSQLPWDYLHSLGVVDYAWCGGLCLLPLVAPTETHKDYKAREVPSIF